MGAQAKSVTSPLFKFRLDRGLTQAKAAGLIGVSQAHWARLEQGKSLPSRELAQQIAARTGISLMTIFFGSSDSDSSTNEQDSSVNAVA